MADTSGDFRPVSSRPVDWRWRWGAGAWPAGLLLLGLVLGWGQGFDEAFARDPLGEGWQVAGDPEQFRWDRKAEALRVVWDSSRSNAYFARPLGTVLNRRDDFRLGFALRLEEIAVGTTPGKPFTFELAVGFVNWQQAIQPGFRRGTGSGSPNLVELAYFPDSGYGATIWPTVVGRDGRFNYQGRDDFTLFELGVGREYRFELEYRADGQTLRTRLWQDGVEVGPVHDLRLGERFTDYAVDTFAICSYSDAGAQGSLRATGWVDEVTVRVPPPPLDRVTGRFSGTAWRVEFPAAPGWTNWQYALERSVGLDTWTTISTEFQPAPGDQLLLVDPAPPPAAVYRVRADKP